MRPITIAVLQETGEDYKRNFPNRMKEYMTKTEATEQEFVEHELDVWERVHYDLHLMKIKENNPWFHLEDDELEILTEAIKTEGFDKMYFYAKRKLEFLEQQKAPKQDGLGINSKTADSLPKHEDSIIVVDTEKRDRIVAVKKEPAKPKYLLRSICIAIYCLDWSIDSLEAKKILRKYFGHESPPGLKNNVIIRASDITAIAENPNEDKWRKKYIEQAKRLLNGEKNQKAKDTIYQLQKEFKANWDNFHKNITG